MRLSVRQKDILDLVQAHGSLSIIDLADRLDVSDETIRRNVRPLETAGLVVKVHGGVMLPEQMHEPPIEKRMRQQAEAKKRIAESVARRIRDGDSLMIDTGSTTAYVARALCQRANLMVVTNSTQIANMLSTRNGNRVFMAGGELRDHDAAAFGLDTITFVRKFQVRYAILSMAAVHPEKGCMDFHPCEADFSNALMDQAEHVMVVADATKFNRTSLVKVCDFDRIHMLVTDAPPDAELADRLAANEVDVVLP